MHASFQDSSNCNSDPISTQGVAAPTVGRALNEEDLSAVAGGGLHAGRPQTPRSSKDTTTPMDLRLCHKQTHELYESRIPQCTVRLLHPVDRVLSVSRGSPVHGAVGPGRRRLRRDVIANGSIGRMKKRERQHQREISHAIVPGFDG